jgi:hypothetical protein
VAGIPWERAAIAWLCANPNATHEECVSSGHCGGRSYHAFRVKRDDLTKKRYSVRDERAANPPSQLMTRDQTPEERTAYFAAVEHASMLRAKSAKRTDETEWFAPDDGLPVGLLCDGDWHCGAHGVAYDALDQRLALLRDTDGLYGVGMGDYHEGVSIHSKAAPALYSGCYNSGDEQEERVMMRLRTPGSGKWIVLTKGNHDAWVERHAGLSRTERLAREIGVEHFGEGGGTIYANVGEQRYVIGVRHNHSGNSQLNTSNAQRRMVDSWLSWDTLHAAVLAHFHFNDLHVAPRHGKRCIYLRSGTYKIYDSYAKGGGFYPEMGSPLLILLPDEEKILPYRGDDLDYGLKMLAQLRTEYASRIPHTVDAA